jgi:hypothetical protein
LQPDAAKGHELFQLLQEAWVGMLKLAANAAARPSMKMTFSSPQGRFAAAAAGSGASATTAAVAVRNQVSTVRAGEPAGRRRAGASSPFLLTVMQFTNPTRCG